MRPRTVQLWFIVLCTVFFVGCFIEQAKRRIATREKERLYKLVKQGDRSQRMDAVRQLGEVKDKDAVDILCNALDDSDQHVRAWAAWSLGQIGDERAILHLIEVLEKYEAVSKTDVFGDESKCLADMYLALESLTGKKYGLDVAAWKAFWIEKQH